MTLGNKRSTFDLRLLDKYVGKQLADIHEKFLPTGKPRYWVDAGEEIKDQAYCGPVRNGVVFVNNSEYDKRRARALQKNLYRRSTA